MFRYYTVNIFFKTFLFKILYTEPTKLKNPPSNWPRTAKFEGLIHRFRRSFLLNDKSCFDTTRSISSLKRFFSKLSLSKNERRKR
jgi:hypothetical protein